MKDLTHCPICARKDFTTLYPATFRGNVADAPSYFLANRQAIAHGRIVKCSSCGFVFTTPQFLPEEYDQIYKEVAARHPGLSDIDAGNSARYARLARMVRRHVPEARRFLDFGCGDGNFLNALPEHDGIGFEVGEESESFADGKHVITGDFFRRIGAAPILPNSFDLVTSFDVLEHLPDLDSYIQAFHQIIIPGGALVVTVPDISSWLARFMREKWNMILLEHLWYFSVDTLKMLMEKNGFELVLARKIPYDVTLSYFVRRLSQIYLPFEVSVPRYLRDIGIPAPAGLLFALCRKI
jgi:2-polyprenyl-3-methyl-5-hydroxy-6-metoxy-1,4-benzoquinol methylase